MGSAEQGGLHRRGTPLMDLAEKIQSGDLTTVAAIEQARTIIEQATTPTT